jgi:superfamily II DNA/RNA helicase
MPALTDTTAPSRALRFDQLGLSDALSGVLEQSGITMPFPIQAATIPDAIAGRDVCGKAPTGSGKTLAFGLAVLSRLEGRSHAGRRGRRHPSALVLVPTRELAAQIQADLTPLARSIGARVAAIYGGVGYGKQLSDLRNGVDILVACPGRLTDLVDRRSVDLSHVDIVVVDEADRMADMGFLPPVRRLIDLTAADRQMLLFSATLDGPVNKLVRDYQRDPVRHEVQPSTASQGQVHHHFWRVDAQERFAITAASVSARGPAMVFCRTKHGADRLSQRLARSGLQSAAIHGDRSQGQRERALEAFRAGRLDVLVATDIAARGIHVDAVPLVVHFDPPADHTDYVHRAGRTGRAGADGIVVSLITHEQRAKTGELQRKLGMPGTITSPDVPALGAVGPPSRPRKGRSPNGGEAFDSAITTAPPRAAARRGNAKPGRPSRQRNRRSSRG